MEFIGEGQSAKVFKNGNHAIKVFKNSNTIPKTEYDILNKISHIDITPKPISHTDNTLEMELLVGKKFTDYITSNPLSTKRVITNFMQNIVKIYKCNLIPLDLHLDNILVVNDEIKIIDVGEFKEIDSNTIEDILEGYIVPYFLIDYIEDYCYIFEDLGFNNNTDETLVF